MLRLEISPQEFFDEERQEFVSSKGQILQLEHSLVSISKWESKWKKPFLSKEDKTYEETIDYIRCMTITQNVDSDVYRGITQEHIRMINEYTADTMTATFFTDHSPKRGNGKLVTSELIYYWMIALNIPFECQKWHLNRLLTLIKVCNLESAPPKKQSKRSILSQNAALNAARRKRLGTRG